MPSRWLRAAYYLHARRVGGLNMWNDPIVEETRKIRDELAAKFNYDVEKLGQYYQSRQKSEEREIVKRPPKKGEKSRLITNSV
jgi:hypothetical protein